MMMALSGLGHRLNKSRELGFFLITGLVMLQVCLVFFGITGPIRVASGFIFMTFLFGYVFLSLFYLPYHEDIRILEQFILAIPISLALNVTIGLLLNFLGIGLPVKPQTIWVSLLIFILALFSYFQKSNQLREKKKLSALLLIIGLVFPVLALNFSLLNVQGLEEEPIISFYVLDPDSYNQNYPQDVQAGVPSEFLLGLDYQGNSIQEFKLISSHDNELRLSLEPGEKWVRKTKITFDNPGLHKITWALYKPEGDFPIRTVQLWITVH